MRIYDNKYYIVESTPGISGFQRWDEREYRIVRGKTARSLYKLHIVREFIFKGGTFRIEDGHFPKYQPTTTSLAQLTDYLDTGLKAVILSPELYGLKITGHNR